MSVAWQQFRRARWKLCLAHGKAGLKPASAYHKPLSQSRGARGCAPLLAARECQDTLGFWSVGLDHGAGRLQGLYIGGGVACFCQDLVGFGAELRSGAAHSRGSSGQSSHHAEVVGSASLCGLGQAAGGPITSTLHFFGRELGIPQEN